MDVSIRKKMLKEKTMAKLSSDEFMKSIQSIIGDRTDDEALKFLEDAKDTITSEHDDYKAKYEAEVEAKKKLDEDWRAKYKARFYSSDDDTNINKDNNKDNTKNDPNFDTRSDAEKLAESITIDDLFKPAE